ncbi:MAG: hypothetical protein IPI32_07730 [Austwickia sp.]|jgi:hypothetical protein|nr:hypothetical protein [Austwickia sp.]MBK9102296.1 hypothetical protein [Austwickia sp.]
MSSSAIPSSSARSSVAPFGLTPLLRAAAQTLGVPVTGDLRWLYAGARDLCGLTAADRELIHVVTGEVIPRELTGLGVRVSFFTLQLAMDRLTGPLADGRDVSIRYLEDVFTRYEEGCPDGNPVSGELLDLGLAFLVGRELARLDASLVA